MKTRYSVANSLTKKILFYFIAGLLVGCVPSLHPLYTDKELIFEEKLLGAWTTENGDQWVFEKTSDPNSYKLTISEKEKKGEFIAHLVKIDNMLFLDLFPDEPKLEGASDFYKLHLLPVHTFVKIEQIEPTLKMKIMDADKTKELLQNDPNLLKHELVEDRFVLTASTKNLQKFMKNQTNIEKVFGDVGELERFRPQEPNKPAAPESDKNTKEK